MADEKEKILLENFYEYYDLALDALAQKKYNSAATLFFKSIVAICDLYILKKEGRAPTSHTDRFRILEQKYEHIYLIVDKDFSFYQDSYTKKLDEEAAEMLRKDAERIKKMLGI